MTIPLPEPERESATSIETAIQNRRSRRSFASSPVEKSDVSQLLWAGQGITGDRGSDAFRAAPSAGATYPLTLSLEVAPDGAVGIAPGLYRYEPSEHALDEVVAEPVREDLVRAAMGQDVVREAPVTIAVTADYERTVREYPDHGRRYVHMEAGHVAQNVQLACESRGLSSCPVGAFVDDALDEALALPPERDSLSLVPVGNRR